MKNSESQKSKNAKRSQSVADEEMIPVYLDKYVKPEHNSKPFTPCQPTVNHELFLYGKQKEIVMFVRASVAVLWSHHSAESA